MTGEPNPTARPSALAIRSAGLDLRSLWVPVFVGLCVMLFVPYTTGAMHWFFDEDWVPIQPVYYMLLMGGAVVAMGMVKRPEFTTASLLVLGLVAARAIDTSFLQRFLYPGP